MKRALIATALLSLSFAVPAFSADGGQPPNAQSQALGLFEQGDSLLQSSKYEEAKKAFTEAIALNPNYVEAYDSLGKVLMLQLKYDEATQEFAKAIKLSPDDYTAYFNQGVAFYHLGKLNEAIHDFTEVIRLYPKNHAAYNIRGIAYFEQGKLEKLSVTTQRPFSSILAIPKRTIIGESLTCDREKLPKQSVISPNLENLGLDQPEHILTNARFNLIHGDHIREIFSEAKSSLNRL